MEKACLELIGPLITCVACRNDRVMRPSNTTFEDWFAAHTELMGNKSEREDVKRICFFSAQSESLEA